MNNFDFKKWMIKNKTSMYSKTSVDEFYDFDNDQVVNRGDLKEIDPSALGAPQAAADAEMQKQDDENGDEVNNASMGVVAEDDVEETVGWATITKLADPPQKKQRF